jgi:hypothetical protein
MLNVLLHRRAGQGLAMTVQPTRRTAVGWKVVAAAAWCVALAVGLAMLDVVRLGVYDGISDSDRFLGQLFGSILLLYSVSLLLAPARRFYRGSGSWSMHLGWFMAGWIWTAMALWSVSQSAIVAGVGMVLISAAYFFHGTRIGQAWSNSPSWARRLAIALALGYAVMGFAWAMSDSVSQGSAQIAALSQDAVFLLIAYAYAITALTPNNIGWFVESCPTYPRAITELGRWLSTRRGTLLAWLSSLPLLILIGLSSAFDSNSADSGSAIVSMSLLPAYVLLLLPAVGFGVAIARAADTGVQLTTSSRHELIARSRPALSMLMLLGAMTLGNLYTWAVGTNGNGWSSAVRLTHWLNATLFFQSNPDDTRLPFVGIVFLSIVAQYLLLVELPFWLGQRTFKKAEQHRTAEDQRAAESRLAELTTEGATSTAGALPAAVFAAWARYALCVDQAHASQDIPLHTFKGFLDTGRKVLFALSGTLLTFLVGSKGPITELFNAIAK